MQNFIENMTGDQFLKSPHTRKELYAYVTKLFAELPLPAEMSVKQMKDEYNYLLSLFTNSTACRDLRSQITDECIQPDQRDVGHRIATEWAGHVRDLAEIRMHELQAEAVRRAAVDTGKVTEEEPAVGKTPKKKVPAKKTKKKVTRTGTSDDTFDLEELASVIRTMDSNSSVTIEKMYAVAAEKVLALIEERGHSFPAKWFYEDLVMLYINVEGVPQALEDTRDPENYLKRFTSRPATLAERLQRASAERNISPKALSWLETNIDIWRLSLYSVAKVDYVASFEAYLERNERKFGHVFTAKQKKELLLYILRGTTLPTDDLDGEAFEQYDKVLSGVLPERLQLRFLGWTDYGLTGIGTLLYCARYQTWKGGPPWLREEAVSESEVINFVTTRVRESAWRYLPVNVSDAEREVVCAMLMSMMMQIWLGEFSWKDAMHPHAILPKLLDFKYAAPTMRKHWVKVVVAGAHQPAENAVHYCRWLHESRF